MHDLNAVDALETCSASKVSKAITINITTMTVTIAISITIAITAIIVITIITILVLEGVCTGAPKTFLTSGISNPLPTS